jgi:hypothetical protein
MLVRRGLATHFEAIPHHDTSDLLEADRIEASAGLEAEHGRRIDAELGPHAQLWQLAHGDRVFLEVSEPFKGLRIAPHESAAIDVETKHAWRTQRIDACPHADAWRLRQHHRRELRRKVFLAELPIRDP